MAEVNESWSRFQSPTYWELHVQIPKMFLDHVQFGMTDLLMCWFEISVPCSPKYFRQVHLLIFFLTKKTWFRKNGEQQAYALPLTSRVRRGVGSVCRPGLTADVWNRAAALWYRWKSFQIPDSGENRRWLISSSFDTKTNRISCCRCCWGCFVMLWFFLIKGQGWIASCQPTAGMVRVTTSWLLVTAVWRDSNPFPFPPL